MVSVDKHFGNLSQRRIYCTEDGAGMVVLELWLLLFWFHFEKSDIWRHSQWISHHCCCCYWLECEWVGWYCWLDPPILKSPPFGHHFTSHPPTLDTLSGNFLITLHKASFCWTQSVYCLYYCRWSVLKIICDGFFIILHFWSDRSLSLNYLGCFVSI